VVQAVSGGEVAWEEESCSILYRAARCTVDTVRRGESWWAAAAHWVRGAARLRVLATVPRRGHTRGLSATRERAGQLGGLAASEVFDRSTGLGVGDSVHGVGRGYRCVRLRGDVCCGECS
jgi:hypothetical protein